MSIISKDEKVKQSVFNDTQLQETFDKCKENLSEPRFFVKGTEQPNNVVVTSMKRVLKRGQFLKVK